jgi:hypothetical protein
MKASMGWDLKDLNVMIKEGMNLGWVLDFFRALARTTLVNTSR